MNKPIGNLSSYEISAVIPPEMIAPLLEMLQKTGGHLVHMRSSSKPKAKPSKVKLLRPYGKETAPGIILALLAKKNSELYRGDLRKALENSGHAPNSVGPICTMLQKQGRIFSPRRGFWQVK
jgi:hypothetical protein